MTAAGRAGHIVATHKGNGRGKRMLLIGHLDTVFEPDTPFQKLRPARAIAAPGPGVGDDKGGMAVMVAALRAMQAAGTLKDADIKVVLTGDEEDAGRPDRRSRAARPDRGRANGPTSRSTSKVWPSDERPATWARSRAAAPTAGRVTATRPHRPLQRRVRDRLGYGAIYELARILDAFRRELPEHNLTFNVGLIGGGATGAASTPTGSALDATGKTNIIAATAIARGDLRALTPDQDRPRARRRCRRSSPSICPARRRSSSSTRTAIRRWRRPRATARCSTRLNARQPRPRPGRDGRVRPGEARRRRHQLRRRRRRRPGRPRPGRRGTPMRRAKASTSPSISRQAKRAAILMTRLAKEQR